MTPEIRVFIRALRDGKTSGDAFEEYCWAKSAVQIDERDWQVTGDPFQCPPVWNSMAEAKAADTFDAGGTDDEIAQAFNEGLTYDRERGLLWRAMTKAGRPTAGQLLRAMDRETIMEAGRLLGYANVAQAFASR